jgi:hypothetical protein
VVKGGGHLFKLFRNYCAPNPENNITYKVFLPSVAKPPLLAGVRRRQAPSIQQGERTFF